MTLETALEKLADANERNEKLEAALRVAVGMLEECTHKDPDTASSWRASVDLIKQALRK